MSNYDEWKLVCETWCKKVGAELLFVNSDNFGCQTPNGELLHIYADELAELLKKEAK